MLYVIYVYLFLFIIRPFENWALFENIRIERFYGTIMLGAFLLSGNRRSIRSPQTTAVFAFLCSIGISIVLAYRPELAWREFYKYCTAVAFYMVIVGFIKNEKQLCSFVLAYVCVMAVYQLLSLREYFFFGRGAWDGGMWRMIGLDHTFGHPNSVASSIAYSMPFVLVFLKGNARSFVRSAVVAYSVLGFTCIVLTGSRSGFLAYFLAWLVLILTLPTKRRLYAIMVFCAFFLLAWQLVPLEKQARFRTILGEHMNEGERNSAEGRIKGTGFWDGLRMFRDHPVSGIGKGCFAAYRHEQLGGIRYDAHNLYGELIGELGILGTLAFACLVAMTFSNAVFVRRLVRKGVVPRDSPSSRFAWAVVVMLLLLVFEGWASHNVSRYNWLWGAAIAILARDFALRYGHGALSHDSQKNQHGLRDVVLRG